ncbi:hypothetical protein [Legionella bononiensis]|uniref:Transmembrane protein n=1 Tax=Legionella bononiensis TaxID=2793102 RepID=A0ABS1WFS0_9GAMM|nr:hypothetical protein [Legionella bononiensis]MBL7481638.1 hypothetical protein [Legionella bononiensis]MBL7528185.1 hypothetical protein [Legionella bononiensis]MBL7562661.1 hypothetical protein [Legionella bononiensis]
MNLFRFKQVIILMLASLTFGALHASEPNIVNEQAKLSIQAVIVPSNPESGLISCRNTLANCLVTMTFTNPNRGYVTILNSSNINALNVMATLPEDWNGDVVQVSTCELLKAGESCSLVFELSSTASSPHNLRTIPVKGSNTTTVLFDMVVTP